VRRGAGASGSTHVYLAIFESLLQILVDGLVGDLADQGKIGDTNFLLLGRLEDGLGCELGLGLGASSGLARGAVGFPLHVQHVSLHSSLQVSLRLTMVGARRRAGTCSLSRPVGYWVCCWFQGAANI
jgi:hypothetical protein